MSKRCLVTWRELVDVKLYLFVSVPVRVEVGRADCRDTGRLVVESSVLFGQVRGNESRIPCTSSQNIGRPHEKLL